ncbi:hypothetical protein [Acidovorax sp. CCYZU-2555]|uniref:hypothetical protein n=1 Tax=Acidovorax sp. CCYZU-2555 TaxID=2835042 RepID=UPI001BCFF9BE|nr:hypothetical protein [Acidovorax sp. CCYZU-2555]MBS7780219.1 hypothetical protein [Acidovorax sp. CCYZU-2555]
MIHKRPLITAAQALPMQSATRPGDTRITLSTQLSASLQHLKQHITLLPEPYSCCVLFFTVAAQGEQAGVFFVRRSTLEAAWREGSTRVRQWAWARKLSVVEFRIDWPSEIVVIGSRIPTLGQWGPASAWALADDNLEHAELIPSLELPPASQGNIDMHSKPSVATPMFPLLADVNLLLRLQALHIGEDGVHTHLPHGRPVQSMPLRPPRPRMPAPETTPPWCEQQQHDGSHGFGCDRLCVTYALMLAQHHIAETSLAQSDVIQAIERAFACVEKNIDDLRVRADAAYIEQTMCLLIFTRYIANRDTDGAFNNLIRHMERLAQHLKTINNVPPTGSGL